MKAGIRLIIISILAFLIISCNTNEPVPLPEKPPGYQDDIPWPSLADSPWPIHHGDAQSTGRSKYKGPSIGVLEWEYTFNSDFRSGVVITEDEQVVSSTSSALLNLSNTGILNWELGVQGFKIYNTPAITSKNNLIFFDGSNRFLSVNMNRDTNWVFEFDPSNLSVKSPNFDLEGNIYFITKGNNKGTLYKLSQYGELLWKFEDDRFYKLWVVNQISFSPDGRYLYFPGQTKSIIAVDIIDKKIIWEYGNSFTSNVLVDSFGLIYFQTEDGMTCINENGNGKWKFDHGKTNSLGPTTAPTIDKLGNIYFATDTLYSINYKGELRWKKYLGGMSDAPLICDNQNDIYIGVILNGVTILKFNQDGNIIWTVNSPGTSLYGSPAITKSGNLIYPTFNSNQLISIK